MSPWGCAVIFSISTFSPRLNFSSIRMARRSALRMRMAVDAVRGPRSALREHLFVRMGRKILPALREVFDRFVTGAELDAEAALAWGLVDRITPPT